MTKNKNPPALGFDDDGLPTKRIADTKPNWPPHLPRHAQGRDVLCGVTNEGENGGKPRSNGKKKIKNPTPLGFDDEDIMPIKKPSKKKPAIASHQSDSALCHSPVSDRRGMTKAVEKKNGAVKKPSASKNKKITSPASASVALEALFQILREPSEKGAVRIAAAKIILENIKNHETESTHLYPDCEQQSVLVEIENLLKEFTTAKLAGSPITHQVD